MAAWGTAALRGLPQWLSGEEYACKAGVQVRSPRWEDPLEKEMATRSSILVWVRFRAEGWILKVWEIPASASGFGSNLCFRSAAGHRGENPGVLEFSQKWFRFQGGGDCGWPDRLPAAPAHHCAIPWTAAYQAPLSMGFSRQEYWSGVPLPSPRANMKQRIKMG